MVEKVCRFHAACDFGAKRNSNLPGECAVMGVISWTPAACTMPMSPPCQTVSFLSTSMPKASSMFICWSRLATLSPPCAMPATTRPCGACLPRTTLRLCSWREETFLDNASVVCRILRSTGGLCQGSSASSAESCWRSSETSSSASLMSRFWDSPALEEAPTASLIIAYTSAVISCTLSKAGFTSTEGASLLSSWSFSVTASSATACCLRPMKSMAV
mmetsp:Transcript_31328/g.71173  ORF Transcript_31328/g.71173 Transcript_31328/m.71173 type:complete len:217 (-) Transcript_31328:80-730(-)